MEEEERFGVWVGAWLRRRGNMTGRERGRERIEGKLDLT